MVEISWVAIPAAVGVGLTALVEILKAFGVIGEGNGGRVSLAFGIIASALLTFGTSVLDWNLEGEQVKAVFEVIGLLGSIALTFLGSFGSHKLLKAAKIFPQHR